MASSERIFTLLDTPVAVMAPATPARLAAVRGPVAFEDVSFAYQDEEWVLRDVDFAVEPGQRVALVGATGAGKTTVISLLARFYDVHRGPGDAGRRGRARPGPRRAPLVAGARAAGRAPVHRHHRLQHPARLDHPATSACEAAARAVHAHRFIEALPGGYDAEVTGAGRHAVGGTEAAALVRARAGPRSARADPGRGHLLGRHRDRGAHPGRAQGPAEGPHRDRDRAPAVHHPVGGRDPGDAQGPHPRARAPRGAARRSAGCTGRSTSSSTRTRSWPAPAARPRDLPAPA